MARIRTVKPEFFTSEQVAECSPNARLLFIGMWCFCDDQGVHPASTARLKMEVFPGDDLTKSQIADMVAELVAHGLLQEYDVEGQKYWLVTGWKHQKIDKPSRKYPLPFDECSTNVPVAVIERSVTEGKGRDVEEEQEPPLPPKGESADGEGEKPKPKREPKIGLDAFLQACRDAGESAVPTGDPVFAYADSIGLPREFVVLAWRWFKARYATKRQAGIRGWRQTFRNAVEGNWPKFWYVDDAGQWHLTTTGKQAQMAADAQPLEAAA